MSQTQLMTLVIHCECVSCADGKFRWACYTLRWIWWTHISRTYEGLRKGWRSNTVSSFSNPRTRQWNRPWKAHGWCLFCSTAANIPDTGHFLSQTAPSVISGQRGVILAFLATAWEKSIDHGILGDTATMLTDSMQLWINLLSRCHRSTTPISMDTK